jgi:hypothetical protein
MHLHARLVLSIAALGCVGAGLGAGCGGFSTDDGAAPDAAVDSPVIPQEAAVADAATDARAPLDAALVCPTGALLCDDFERATLLGTWSAFVGDNDAAAEASTLAIDTEFASSPTRSLKSTPKSITQAALAKILSNVNRVEISFSLRTQIASPEQVHLITVQFDQDVGFAQVLLKDGQLILLEQLRPPADSGTEVFLPENAGPAPIGTFARYTFIVDRTTKQLSLEPQGGLGLKKLLTQPQGPMTSLLLGTAFTSGDSAPYWIDDVVVLATP